MLLLQQRLHWKQNKKGHRRLSTLEKDAFTLHQRLWLSSQQHRGMSGVTRLLKSLRADERRCDCSSLILMPRLQCPLTLGWKEGFNVDSRLIFFACLFQRQINIEITLLYCFAQRPTCPPLKQSTVTTKPHKVLQKSPNKRPPTFKSWSLILL